MYKPSIDEIIGVVKKDSSWRIFGGTIAEWIMDYKANDPSYNPEDYEYPFRNNILQVDENNVYEFLEAMKPQELSIAEISAIKAESEFKNLPLSILIDFNEKLYVNGYPDLLLESYVPNGWKGILDDPLKYVPVEIRHIFL